MDLNAKLLEHQNHPKNDEINISNHELEFFFNKKSNNIDNEECFNIHK